MGDGFSGRIVLLVDDEASIRDAFSRMLQWGGYHPIEASSAEDALSLLDRGLRPSAVLLDLKMPGMGGLAFLLILRSDPRFASIPVAIVTGDCFLDRSTEKAAKVLGASLHFKPVDLDDVLLLTMRLVHEQPRHSLEG